MTDFFVRPWEIFSPGKPIEVDGRLRTPQELRQQLYENVIDESLFISRASEGAVSAEWIMDQPIFIRKKYVRTFTEELKERERLLNKNKKS
jgi:hypothetical protein